ncbi:ribonuclease H-like domain, reverse transcriptase, RNA-dependent DNA polymerase [Tanacetum coccineum]
MFPILSCMAMDILSVQATSVASESVFSTSGKFTWTAQGAVNFPKLWRLKDKVGCSNSDGQDAFVFLKKPVRWAVEGSSLKGNGGKRKGLKAENGMFSGHEINEPVPSQAPLTGHCHQQMIEEPLPSKTIKRAMAKLPNRPQKIQALANRFINRKDRNEQIHVASPDGMYDKTFYESVEYESLLGWMTNDWIDGTILHWWCMHLFEMVSKEEFNTCAFFNPTIIQGRVCDQESNFAIKHILATVEAHKEKEIFLAPYLQDSHWVLFLICPKTRTGYIFDSYKRDKKKTSNSFYLSNTVERAFDNSFKWTMLEAKSIFLSVNLSEINSQDTLINSSPSYNQSNNDSIQVINTPSHFDHTLVRGFRTLNDLYENTEELLLAEDEPKNYKEASTDQKWIEAMKVELDSININNTWELTTLPKGHKAIGLKWVFKTKKDANGNIVKHKARLVAKGYIQEHGIDFEEVFAPVARMETICLLLAIAANNKWEVHHLDVKSAFLHGDLKEEVYVTQPEGFIKRQDQGKVYRLIKALYGLRQAPRAWNIKLDNTLKSLDFKKCALEQAIYTKRSKDSILLIGVYVDDLIITGTPKEEIDNFKAQMEEKFEMSDLGLLAYYLGIEVTQTNGNISIKQSAYVSKILKEAGMIDCNETLIPMDPGTRLTKITEGTMVNSTEYRSLIGCLRYLLHTRPDLSYSVGLLSRFMQEPREQHMKAIRQVLRYVQGTKDHGITYKHNGGNKIHGYSDSSYGVNTQEGKGTTGIIFYYGESPISWSTQKQATVALSSCESEFIAATAAATQALWLKRLLSKLTHSQEEKVIIQVDNKSAIALMKNLVFHG